MPDITIIYGGPGAGKTTELLRIMEQEFKTVDRNRLAFCSFTRQATYGARTRAMEKFGGTSKQYPYFRTLHSLAYRELSLTEGSMLQAGNYADIAASLNLKAGGSFAAHDGPIIGRPDAAKLLGMCELARNRRVDLTAVWKETRSPDLGWFTVKRYQDTLARYKHDTGLLDFTDILDLYLKEGLAIPVEVALVDEAQDLTPLQWDIVFHAFRNVRRLYIAGDDDQAIFRWAGAAVERFQALAGTVRVLDLSHRLPSTLFKAAQVITARIGRRTPKAWTWAREGGGMTWHRRIEAVPGLGEGTWLLLGRNVHLLEQYSTVVMRQGLFFRGRNGDSINHRVIAEILAWEALRAGKTVDAAAARKALPGAGFAVPKGLDPDGQFTAAELGLTAPLPIWHEAFTRLPLKQRVYIVECLRRGERLTRAPRIRIDTIHGAKGAEADNVILLTDMTPRTRQGMRRYPDDEWRCLYVGMTRASRHLHMILPTTVNHYPIHPRSFSE